MKILSDKVIYHDGQHNAFTSLVPWKGKYWLTFRNGTHHKSDDGRIYVINSDDLENWSEPQSLIDTDIDDRDPTLYVHDDQLFLISMSYDRRLHPGEKERRLASKKSYLVHSKDGVTWTDPQLALPENRVIWWVAKGPDANYASVYHVDTAFDGPARSSLSELWRSVDGLQWVKVSVISDEDRATEVALAFLPDHRLFAFIRHDAHDRPVIKYSSPPYTDWTTAYQFDFRHNGPCIGLVGDKLVTSSRAFFVEDEKTPLADERCRERKRGLIMGVFDPSTLQWEPEMAIPHSRGVRGPDDPDCHEVPDMNWPDVSYASIFALNNTQFKMAYYEGFKGWPSDIRLATFSL